MTRDDEIFEVDIKDISVTIVGFALIFKPIYFQTKEVVPIFIGPYEAYSISNELQGIKNPRPNTHDLMINILKELNARILRIVISELKANVFYAKIIIQHEDRILEIDARPSDSVALAIRTKCPIFMSKSVFRESSVVLSNENEDEYTDIPTETTTDITMNSEIEENQNKSQLEILQEKLQQAISQENYEEAAKIRDQIKKLQQKDN